MRQITRGAARAKQAAEDRIADLEENIIEETRLRRFHRAMALKDELGLTDEMRYDLAQMIPGVDKDYGGSWKALNPKQLHDLITMMEGFIYISFLFQQRLDTDQEKD